MVADKKDIEEQDMIQKLSELGYKVEKLDIRTDVHKKVDMSIFKGEEIKIGLVADMHLGSRYQQITHLWAFYKYCKEQGIKIILNAGDITDGQRVYRGQEYELFIMGADAQVNYVIENYPHIKGIKTMFILGNHDENHWKMAGIDIGERIADKRKDMEYLGLHGAYVNIGGISIYLHHGAGGVAYARSYKQQKIIEQFAPEQKPHILVSGHWHVQNYLPNYRNVVGIQMPCFQAQTPYLKRKGVNPEIGGVILSFKIDHTIEPVGIATTKPEFVMFRQQIDKDY